MVWPRLRSLHPSPHHPSFAALPPFLLCHRPDGHVPPEDLNTQGPGAPGKPARNRNRGPCPWNVHPQARWGNRICWGAWPCVVGAVGKVGGLRRVHRAWHICTGFLPDLTESSPPCPSTPTLQGRQLRLGGGEAGLSAALPSTPGRPGGEGAGRDTQTLVTGVGVSKWLTIEILKNIF